MLISTSSSLSCRNRCTGSSKPSHSCSTWTRFTSGNSRPARQGRHMLPKGLTRYQEVSVARSMEASALSRYGFHMSKSCSLHCHLALLMTNLMTMLLQHMLAGAIAGISEHIAMYPMDTIKTRMQALGHPGQRVQPILFSDHFFSIRRALSEKVLCDCAAERVNSPSGHCSCRQKRRHSGLVRWSWCHHMGSRVGFSQAF